MSYTVVCVVWLHNMFIVITAGSTDELKRELAAFEDKVTKMERSLQQVCIRLQSKFVFVYILFLYSSVKLFT